MKKVQYRRGVGGRDQHGDLVRLKINATLTGARRNAAMLACAGRTTDTRRSACLILRHVLPLLWPTFFLHKSPGKLFLLQARVDPGSGRVEVSIGKESKLKQTDVEPI